MMGGFFTFAGNCISWAPHVVFSAVNEATNDMSLGFPILILFYVIAACVFSTVDEKKNRDCIEPTLHKRITNVKR